MKSIIDLNRRQFELEADILEHAQNQADNDSVLEDAWGALCPEVEMERLECVQEYREN